MEQCLAMLRGPTDEHRFVGLMMLPKILDRNSAAVGAEHRQVAFDALDLQFIGRLLTSKSSDNATQMRAVALAVLSSFAGVEQFSNTAVSLAKPLSTALNAEAAVELPDIATAEDMYGTLGGVMVSTSASIALTEEGGVGAAFKLLVSLDAATKTAASNQHSPLMNKTGRCIRSILYAAAASTTPEHQSQRLATSAAELVALIGTTLGSSNTLLKFVALELFTPALVLLQKLTPLQSSLQSSWINDARDGLTEILSARIGASERYAALLAVASLCDSARDSSWLFRQEDGKAKLPQLVMRLVSVELQLLLEDDRTTVSSPRGSDTQEPLPAPSDLLSVCFRLVEIAVLHAQTLPSDHDPDVTSTKDLDGKENDKEARNGLDASQEVAELASTCVCSIAQWLSRIMSHEQTLAPLLASSSTVGTRQAQDIGANLETLVPEPEPAPPPQQERELRQQQGLSERHCAVLLGGARVIGCWAAAAEPQLEIARIIPFLLRDAWRQGDSSAEMSETKALLHISKQSAFDFLYPALLQMSIASPTTRRWLFSNPSLDDSVAERCNMKCSERSIAASLAVEIVHSSGNLGSRQLEILLNILCLEKADGIPPTVALAFGEAAKNIAVSLESRTIGDGLPIDIALATAYVAATVRLLRDSKGVSDVELRSLCVKGCEQAIRWVVASYTKVAEVVRADSDNSAGQAEEVDDVPELWSLTCEILCSLVDSPRAADGSGQITDKSILVATTLRTNAVSCRQMLYNAEAVAQKDMRDAQDFGADQGERASTPVSLAKALLDLVERLMK